jgi:diguanylate cyclase (GGDEF)-like protein
MGILRKGGLRGRLMVGFALMALLLAAAYVPFTKSLIDARFEAFEINEAQDEARRLELVLKERVEALRVHAIDYGDWGATVDYVRTDSPDFIAENVYSGVLTNFDADYAFILDRSLSPRFIGGTPTYTGNPYREALYPLPAARIAPLVTDPRIRALLDKPGAFGLILVIDGRWYMVGASAVTDPRLPGRRPVHGVIGFVSELSPQRLARIADLVGVPFTLSDNTRQPASSRLEAGDVVMHRILQDRNGRAMAALDIRYRQPLTAQIQATHGLFLLAVIGILLLSAGMIWVLIDRGLISRLERLDHGLERLSSGDLGQLPVSRNGDEVDRLAAGVNRLYGELQALNDAWRHEALHDPLTGLGNRAELLRRIEKALGECRSQASVALVLLDLDGFKTINDLYGHAVGDRVLKRVATCLQETLPQDTACFRLGGDEFAVLLLRWTAAEVDAWAERLNRSIRSPQFFENVGTLLSVSIGIAWQLDDGTALVPSELIQRADIALYTIKRRSRDGHATFDESMLSAMQRQNDIQRSLHEAIEAGQIEIWFQPIVAAQGHRVLRFEVLARWQHPTLGWIAPVQFITIAEQFHIATRLDLLVLRKGLSALRSLRAFAPDLLLSVNVSAQSLLHGEYPGRVRALLEELELRGDDFILEVTETSLSQNEDALSEPIAALAALGVRIELDDFGAGYSSLGRLAQLQPHGIKLDGSFVQNLQHGGDRVCRAVVGMARQLGVEVTAEFVETTVEAAFLEKAGCDALQGYLFSEPLPLSACLGWLSERTVAPRAISETTD